MLKQYKATIYKNGKISLPSGIRKKLDLKDGDQIIFEQDDNFVSVKTLKDSLKNIRELININNPNNISLVDSLISLRREEAKNE